MEGPRRRETGRACERQKETKAEKIRQIDRLREGSAGDKRRSTGEIHRERLMPCRSWTHSQGGQDIDRPQLANTEQFPGHREP